MTRRPEYRTCFSRTAVALSVALMVVTHGLANADVLLYENDFEGAVGSEWSSTSTSTTPVGGRRFLGVLQSGTTSLTLSGLPDNQKVTASFDLYVVQSWDGSQLVDPLSNPLHTVGPDVWSLAVDGGPTLLNTTFSVFDGTKAMHSFRNYPQAYPGSYPADLNSARTGAEENDTLGYHEGDSVYHLSFTFDHATGPLVLNFNGTFPAVDPEEWGIDNILVTSTIPEPNSLILASLGGAAAIVGALQKRRR